MSDCDWPSSLAWCVWYDSLVDMLDIHLFKICLNWGFCMVIQHEVLLIHILFHCVSAGGSKSRAIDAVQSVPNSTLMFVWILVASWSQSSWVHWLFDSCLWVCLCQVTRECLLAWQFLPHAACCPQLRIHNKKYSKVTLCNTCNIL